MKKARKLPNGWIEFRIKDKFQTGSGATPLSTKKEFYENGNIPWINSGELESPYINSTSNFITQLGFCPHPRLFKYSFVCKKYCTSCYVWCNCRKGIFA